MGDETRSGQPLEDRVLKEAAQFMGQELLPLLGIKGTMKRIAPTEQVYLKPVDFMEDFNYEMEDGSWVHLEFESDRITKEDLMRFRAYEAVSSYTYGVKVVTYVVCSAKAKRYIEQIEMGLNTYRVHVIRLKGQNADEVLCGLEEKRKAGRLERREFMELLLTPLMDGETTQAERIMRGMKLLKHAGNSLEREDTMRMQAVLYTLAMKFLTEKELEKVKEGMLMTPLGEMIWQDGHEKGMQTGIQTGIEKTARGMILNGEPNEKIALYTELPTEKIIELRKKISMEE